MHIHPAQQIHANKLAEFQCDMAFETENLVLDKEVVEKAILFLITNPIYGKFLVPVQSEAPENPCGMLLVTYENERSWWIQSVFVRKENRRQGIFSALFEKVLNEGKEKGVKKVQLYVEKENEKAKETYHKLGMKCNHNLFFGYDLAFKNSSIIENLSSKIKENFSVVRKSIENGEQNFEGLNKVSGKDDEINYRLECYSEGKLIGFCQIFYEFSDWRFSLIAYINSIWAKSGAESECIDAFMKFLFQNSEIKLGAIRIIANEQEGKKLKELCPSLEESEYEVMEICL